MPFIKTIHKNHIKNAISFQTNKNNILCGDLIYHVNISLYLADGGVIFQTFYFMYFFVILDSIQYYPPSIEFIIFKLFLEETQGNIEQIINKLTLLD